MYVTEIKEKQIFQRIRWQLRIFDCHIHLKSIQTTTQCVCFTVLVFIINTVCHNKS